MSDASPTSCIPPFLNDEKNPGPTCNPIEKTNRIRPNSLMKLSTPGSIVMPKWLAAMPTKRIHVVPSETPPILIFPSRIPTVMTSARTKMVCASVSPKERLYNQYIP